ncbi:MAG: hypothetical protein JJ992_14830, partial [Planctomycetes bacterium]|nr:hypothetical protein [Planctomycetota bacterium]
LENLELDGGLGNDQFFVHSTDADVSVKLWGGAGSDRFDLGGDAPSVIVDMVAQPPLAGPHLLDGIAGALEINGGAGMCSPADTAASHDQVSVYSDGTSTTTSGSLTATSLAGLGLSSSGVTYSDFESFEILLGSGDDNFVVEDTADGMITAAHGGGGADTITALDHGDGTLALFGDTTQDGMRYTGSPGTVLVGSAYEFTNAGNDILDASTATASIVAYGGDGADTIIGTEYDDLIAGGSNGSSTIGTPRDLIDALGGDDLVFGDSGFNFNLVSGAVTVATVGIRCSDAADPLLAGPDEIHGGPGADILIGDFGTATPAGGTPGVLFTGVTFEKAETAVPSQAGNDLLYGDDGPDLIIGGSGADVIDSFGRTVLGLTDADVVVGDNGWATLALGVIQHVETTDFESPQGATPSGASDDDVIRTGNGRDVALGGNGSDVIDTGVQGPYDNGDVTILSINFAGDLYESQITGVAGAVAADHWNNMPSVFSGNDNGNIGNTAPTATNLLFDDGNVASGVSLLWGIELDSTDPREVKRDNHEELDPDSQNGRLFEGFLYAIDNKTLGVDVSGLSSHFATYDVYVYIDADARYSSPGHSVRSITDGTTTYFLDDPEGNTFAGTFVEVSSNDPAHPGLGNYVVFRNVSGDSFSLRIDDDSTLNGHPSNHPSIAGLQIVGGPDKDSVAINGDFDQDVVVGDNGVATFQAGRI